jgi:hypothetical protein
LFTDSELEDLLPVRKGYLEKQPESIFESYNRQLVWVKDKKLSFYNAKNELQGVIDFDLYKVTIKYLEQDGYPAFKLSILGFN